MVERITPKPPGEWQDLETYLMFLRHLAAYNFAGSFSNGQSVLDLGCGAGYGSIEVAKTAKNVLGLDVSARALQNNGSSPGVMFVKGKCEQLPIPDQSFDLIISHQVIEHIWDETSYLEEIERALKADGYFIVSTPNKAIRLLPYQPPINPYHIREYTQQSLRNLLEQHFTKVDVKGLQATPEIMAMERERLKQNPVKVYVELIAQKVLPFSLANNLRKVVSSFRQRIKPGLTSYNQPSTQPSFWENRYSINDYWLDDNRIDASLDLIGICQK